MFLTELPPSPGVLLCGTGALITDAGPHVEPLMEDVAGGQCVPHSYAVSNDGQAILARGDRRRHFGFVWCDKLARELKIEWALPGRGTFLPKARSQRHLPSPANPDSRVSPSSSPLQERPFLTIPAPPTWSSLSWPLAFQRFLAH